MKKIRSAEQAGKPAPASQPITREELHELALACGADDAGIVAISHEELDPQRDEILRHYPWTKSLVSVIVKMSQEPLRGTPRSVANLEFHHVGHKVNETGAFMVAALQDRGIRAVNPAMGFPMEMQQNPGAIWIVSHKPVAIAAGMGRMGIHRNLIHPKFGNFVLLGTILLDQEVESYDEPIDYNPCIECKLCVAACPVDAIKPTGEFDFSACFTHNYREFMGGFTDWVEQVADSSDALDYRKRMSEPETASMWQSLTYGANYKSAYCMAVCPAGEDVLGPYLEDKVAHRQAILKPFQDRAETIYVVAGTDAEAAARRKWKHKTIKIVGNGQAPRTISSLLTLMPVVFQPGQSEGLDATYHFTFTGAEQREVTITVKDRKLEIHDGHIGKADLRMTADSKTWLGFLAKEKNLFWALARRKFRISGNPKLLLAFGRCFPSPDVKRKHVEVLPEESLIKPVFKPFDKNDRMSGRLRWQGELVLKEVEQVTHNVKTFRFVNPKGGDLPFQHVAYQFVTLDIEPQGIPTKRSYTIASSPSWRDRMEITVKREDQGLVSRWLHDELKPGTPVRIEAPSGTFGFSGQEAASVVLIGGGVGITPMMSIARYLTDTNWPGTIYMILGFLNPREYIFEREIEELKARNPLLRVVATVNETSDLPWSGPTGFVDARLISATVPDIALHQVYVCGPPPMMAAVTKTLDGLGVPPTQVKTEAFGTDKRDPTKRADKSGKPIGKVRFETSGLTAEAHDGMSLLEVAEEAKVYIENACRSGSCGACIVKLKSGKANIAVNDALSAEELAEGYVLTCQAQPVGDVVLEA
ncbi:2Fe-2S iron-sulfur cluster-binding protein [Sulfitobacter porphyrae]|uniref:2Fe-2S iron-sulfur cluster-binding protein n=1 Tax=Sulfitobacter porphyrae TaxID=1246864 RepID=A0ABW2B8P4_9RHOB